MTPLELRKHLNLTQNQMAERLGISRETYWKIENGTPPSKPVQKLLDMEEASLAGAPLSNAH